MTTKYILHGGSAQKINVDNDKFFEEIIKDVSSDAKVLLVHFAVLKENILVNQDKDISQFKRNQGSKNLSYEIAQKDVFIDQVSSADIIYFGGGVSTSLLVDSLELYPNLKSVFEGKTVAGESAGANCLAAYGYSPSAAKIVKGLGIIPVFVIPHYQIGDELKISNIPLSSEKLFLPVFKYKVFIQ